jgi:O-antigen/teichoic acid export membrane protein
MSVSSPSVESSTGRTTRVVVRNSMFGFGGQAVMKVLSFTFSVLIVRHLGADTYGQYAAILAFGGVFVFLADFGLSPYLVREVARARDEPDGRERVEQLYGTVLVLRLVLSLMTAAVVIGSAWLTGRPLPMLIAIALGAFGLMMYAPQGTADAMLSGRERFDLSTAAKVLNQIIFVCLGAVALWLGIGYFGLVAANLAGVAVMTWATVHAVSRLGLHPRRPRLSTWLPLLRAALPFGVIAFTLGLSYKFDSVLLNVFRGDAETGYYNAVYNLVFSVTVLSNVINTALYPSLSRAAATTPSDLPSIYERALRYLMVLALPIAMGVSLLADPIVRFLFTDAFAPAATALQIVIWTVPLMFASEFLGYVVVVQGKERRVARAIVVSTSVNVLLNLALVPVFGFVAAAVMTVLTEAVLVGQYIWTLRDMLRQLRWEHLLVRPIIAALAMGILVLLSRGLPLLVSLSVAATSYTVFLVVLGVVGKDEIRFLRSMRRPALLAGQRLTPETDTP